MNFDTALTDFNSRQFKTWMKKMAAQVNFFCFLKFFSVWLAIWRLKISTFVLIKVLLTYLKVLQGASHRWRWESAFSVRVVKYWNKLPASVVTAPYDNVFKKRLAKVWTEVYNIWVCSMIKPPVMSRSPTTEWRDDQRRLLCREGVLPQRTCVR